MRYLTLAEVLRIHDGVIHESGGAPGVRDLRLLESAVAQPRAAFAGVDLYGDLATKAAAYCLSLCSNHPFIDGNKRSAHAAMEVFLLLNGSEISASVDEQESLMLSLAAGDIARDELVQWLRNHIVSSEDHRSDSARRRGSP